MMVNVWGAAMSVVEVVLMQELALSSCTARSGVSVTRPPSASLVKLAAAPLGE